MPLTTPFPSLMVSPSLENRTVFKLHRKTQTEHLMPLAYLSVYTKKQALISVFWFILYVFLPVDTYHTDFKTYKIIPAKTELQNDVYIFIFSMKYI